ncbi:hypothetical protein [Blastococcus sp. TF02A-35]|uniref:DoxX family protein n=1 Tax=Blastococcus sp. TF02A-35 TaxID=2559612 RepID=UPI0010739D7C|nr:hypothetical protein [Blastococcus sp. TF02A_35]TFV52521.1 hypothetical protein E4P43_05895 [Blastococcus sp. TF02A_35]
MTDVPALGLAALMTGSGIGHAVAPAYFGRLVPDWLPAPEAAVAVSGALDVLAGVLVAVPATRSAGGWLTAGLITAYLPAHLDPLRRAASAARMFDRTPGIAARVLVNVGYIGWAVAVARAGGPVRRTPTGPRRAPRG